MIGQDNLVSKLKSYSITTLPHSILLLGEQGCGKHTLTKELANYFGIDLVDISNDITLDTLIEISDKPIPTMYLIDCSVLTDKHQNILLKCLEEPSMYAYFVLLSVNKAMLLQTIANRCVSFEFEPYTKEVLAQFVQDDASVLSVCTTPGQVLSLHSGDLANLDVLCDTIVTKIGSANYPNTLSIVKKINLKDEYDKYDINVFFNTLLHKIYTKICNKQDNIVSNKLFEMYNLVLDYKKRLRDARLNKELFLENFLTTLWEFAR